MILVDTSVWIDFFSGRDSPHVNMVETLIQEREDLCTCGVVLTEVLQGIRDNKEFENTRTTLSDIIFLPMDKEVFRLAADIYRTCRSHGITIRNSIDCMIAATCIKHSVGLLHNDKDFDLISSQFDLIIRG